jgi:ABC-type amino acid transport substrate-binding protein
MDDERRRDLLRTLGVAGTVGLAGCQGSDSDGESETTKTTDSTTGAETTGGADAETTAETTEGTTTLTRSLEVEASIGNGEQTSVVVVTGEATVPGGIDEVVVATSEDEGTTRIGARGDVTRSFDAELDVDGGSAYEVEVTVVGSDGTRIEETAETGYVPTDVDAMATDRLVGAHYYPWYEMHGGHQNWTDRTPIDPVLGEYAADDPAVIRQHLDWCLNHGIRWLSVTWWGPNSGSDDALRNAVLEVELSDELAFSILYETTGRFEEFSFDLDRSDARERLRSDLEYLESECFHRENYLRMDDRPVVFFYVANLFEGDVEAAFEEATQGLDADPYVLADLPFGTPPDTYAISPVADGITTYNPYEPRPDIEDVFHDLYERGSEVMHLGAESAGLDFVPTVIPGFDDTELPDDQRPDNPVLSATPERYERVVEQVKPHLADAEAVLVTSFNEWYENTQIEPNDAYGTEYLELTADELATGTSPGFDSTGTTMRLDFEDTIVPAEVNPDSTDTRPLAFMAGGLRLLDGEDELVAYDIGTPGEEPLFVGGAYGTTSNDDRSWRWLGGHGGETTIFVEADVSDADTAILAGQPMRSYEIAADVFFDGERTDHVQFRERTGTFVEYEVSLEADGG